MNKYNSEIVLPIVVAYHAAIIEQDIREWAQQLGLSPDAFYEISRQAIEKHHSEATSGEETHCISSRDEGVFCLTLSLGRPAEIYYSIDRSKAIIRGYGWHLDRVSPEDKDVDGRFFIYLSPRTDKFF